MATAKVPGVSIAVIDRMQIDWVKGYDSGAERPQTRTRLQPPRPPSWHGRDGPRVEEGLNPTRTSTPPEILESPGE
jgi:hypothetical protein